MRRRRMPGVAMNVKHATLIAALIFLPIVGARAETDPRAILQASVTAMGGAAPFTSDATGTITITEGSTTRSGTLRTRTRGLKESNDTIDAQTHEERIYNDGSALERQGDLTRSLSKELAAGTSSSQFPLVALQALLAEPDNVFEYVGREAVEGRQTNHVRVRNTFSSRPDLQPMSEVTARDLWIDTSTRLPVKLALRRFDGRGGTYAVPVAFVYSDYRSVGGKLFPFHVEQNLNGTPYASIAITSVTFDTSVSDDVFDVR
jgi:hypothetical protein